MYWPPDAPESLCTLNGEKVPCPDRLSSSTFNTLPPLLLDEVELDVLELVLVLVLDDVELDVLELVEELVPSHAPTNDQEASLPGTVVVYQFA